MTSKPTPADKRAADIARAADVAVAIVIAGVMPEPRFDGPVARRAGSHAA